MDRRRRSGILSNISNPSTSKSSTKKQPEEDDVIPSSQDMTNTMVSRVRTQITQKKVTKENENYNTPKRAKTTLITGQHAKRTPKKFGPVSTGVPKTYFEQTLTKNGLVFKPDDQLHHTIKSEQSVFVRELKKSLQQSVEYPSNLHEFCNGFRKHIADTNRFRKLLTDTLLQVTDNECDAIAMIAGNIQHSVVRLLLNVDLIQVELLEILLNKLADFAMDEESGLEETRLILRQLRFLEYLSEPGALATNLLNIVEVATVPAQQEILSCIPEVIADPQHDLIALDLSKLITENYDLTPSILDCLENLCISSTKQQEINKKVMQLLASSAPLHVLHILTRFLLATCDIDNMNEVIKGLRLGLDWGPVSIKTFAERASSQVLTFGAVKSALSANKNLADAWIKIMNSVRSENEHKEVDFLIMLILHSTSPIRKRNMEVMIKKRITGNFIRSSLLESTFKHYQPVLVEFHQSLLCVAELLIKDKSKLVMEFGALCFQLAFVHFKQSSLRQSILIELVRLVKFQTISTGPAISVLSEIARCESEALQDHAVHFMGLLDSLDTLTLTQTRLVMDLLCGLAYPPPLAHLSGDRPVTVGARAVQLQGDIHILIRKQLSNLRVAIKRKGVVACVMAVKHIGAQECSDHDASTSSDASFASVAALPEGPPREAATLLELMFKTTQYFPDAQGLCYDELAAMLASHENIDRKFLHWLCDAVTNDFQRFYTVETIPESIDELEIAQRYNINSESSDTPIINIIGLTMNPAKDSHPIVILAPLFRLLRVLFYVLYDGNLDNIDATLGCPIAMPALHPEDGLGDLPTQIRKPVLDSFFHCCNWIRETINAFIKQKDDQIKRKVLLRLRALVKLESHVSNLISKAGKDFKPPLSHFHAPNVLLDVPKVKKTVAKKKRPGQTDDTTTIQSTAAPTQMSKSVQPTTSSITGVTTCSKVMFRALDTDVIVLLREPLSVTDVDTDKHISLEELRFLLEDITAKLETVVGSKHGASDRPEEPPQLSMVIPVALVTDISNHLPRLVKYLEQISELLTRLLAEGDGIRDAPTMFYDNAMLGKHSLGLLFKMIGTLYSWTGFQSSANYNLLRESLAHLTTTSVPSGHSSLISIKELATLAFNNLRKHASITLTLSSAVNLYHMLEPLARFSENAETKEQLVGLCREFLTNYWWDEHGLEEKGALCNLNLNTLIKGYLRNARIKFVAQNITWVQEESAKLSKKNDTMDTFPCINKSTFFLLYRALCMALVTAVAERVERPMSQAQHLAMWGSAMKILGALMAIVKIQDGKNNLSAFLKHSLGLLKLFLAHGMPALESALRTHSDAVTSILKDMQQCTRLIHALCCHSKITHDAGLMSYVPAMILTLESLVFRVKAALVANNCSDAFWMGNLKNRDLRGEEILTQTTVASSNIASSEIAEQEAVDELPVDDSDSDVEEEQQEVEPAGLTSTSGIF